MNGIDKITGQINADVQREIDEILEGARAEAKEITARYDAQAQKELDALLEQGRREAADLEARIVSAAQLEAKKQTLAVKQGLVAQAFDEALNQLLSQTDVEYSSMLSRLLAAACDTGHEKVIFSKKDRARFGKQAVTRANDLAGRRIPGAALTLSEETRPMRGGFILEGDQVEINCSLETLVRMQKESMTAKVAASLFGGVNSGGAKPKGQRPRRGGRQA